MLQISPTTEVKLRHRAYHLAMASSGHVAAVSEDGVGTVIAPDHVSCTPFTVPKRVSALALSPDGCVLAVVANDGLMLISTSTGKVIHRLDTPVESCYFAPTGELWTSVCPARRGMAVGVSDGRRSFISLSTGLPIEAVEEDLLMLEVREPAAWQVIARTGTMDPLGESSFTLMPHPDPRYLTVFGGAGQNGQCIMWAHREAAEIEVEVFQGVDFVGPPSFPSTGDRFVVVCDECELRHYEFPQGPLLGSVAWPLDEDADDEDENNQIGLLTTYADAQRALLRTGADRIYVVSLDDMSVGDEIVIRGHETGQFSDCVDVQVLPDGQLLSTHYDTHTSAPGECRCSLATWNLPPIGSSR